MPQTEVVIFADEDGSAPLLMWMDGLQVKARDKCTVRIERLAERGHELGDLDAVYQRWNARIEQDGRLVPEISPL